ncbi:MAG: glutathione S-transferase family protein [Alphaproteobacteria bacterium]|nr:glutathione S-transferase family protein [Alphaproteobacteria bacterium]
MYILYGGPFTRALITEMVMAEGDIAHELRPVDILNNGHRTPEFLKINPAGWVPALITPEGDHLFETPAINLYLAERHELTHLAPAVGDPDRGMFLSGLFSLADELEPAMKRVFYAHRYVVRPEDTAAAKQLALDAALERLQVIEERLSKGGPYYLGERFSLIDLTLSYWTGSLASQGLLEPFPAIGACTALVRARRKLQVHFAQLDEMRVKYAGLLAQDQGVK